MAKKNVLGEVKKLDSVKGQNKTTFKANKQAIDTELNTSSDSTCWEAWECYGDTNDQANWEQVKEGSLEECFEELYDPIHCQIEESWVEGTIDELEAKYGHEPDGVLEAMQRMSQPHVDAFKTGSCVCSVLNFNYNRYFSFKIKAYRHL